MNTKIKIEHDTGKAVLARGKWFPKSQIKIEGDLVIEIPDWLAKKNGIASTDRSELSSIGSEAKAHLQGKDLGVKTNDPKKAGKWVGFASCSWGIHEGRAVLLSEFQIENWKGTLFPSKELALASLN